MHIALHVPRKVCLVSGLCCSLSPPHHHHFYLTPPVRAPRELLLFPSPPSLLLGQLSQNTARNQGELRGARWDVTS